MPATFLRHISRRTSAQDTTSARTIAPGLLPSTIGCLDSRVSKRTPPRSSDLRKICMNPLYLKSLPSKIWRDWKNERSKNCRDRFSQMRADFFNALALLHSTAENSTEKLRRMLDACIERKRGRTLAARMPRTFLHEGPATRRRREDDASRAANRPTADVSAREECCNDEDVPRISIPDEGSPADGTVCKVFLD